MPAIWRLVASLVATSDVSKIKELSKSSAQVSTQMPNLNQQKTIRLLKQPCAFRTALFVSSQHSASMASRPRRLFKCGWQLTFTRGAPSKVVHHCASYTWANLR